MNAPLPVVHAAATWAMVGLIWTVQVVHYPLLEGIDRARYPRWQRRHMTLITWLVGPLMAVEAGTAAALLVTRPSAWTWSGAVLLALVWLLTATVQAPLHGRLAREGFDARLHRRLVTSNWLRTAAWSVRGLLAAGLLLQGPAVS